MYGESPSDEHQGVVSTNLGQEGPGQTAASDLTLYIVFGVALLVFLLVLIIIVKILKRKNPNPNGYTLTSTGKVFSIVLQEFYFFVSFSVAFYTTMRA